MKYKPTKAGWEITMGCNMRCKHCGSSCMEALKDELTTEEALKLCDDIAKLGVKHITLTGGEPTTRKDWHIIAKRLYDNGVTPNIITNGWLLDEDILQKAIDAHVKTIGISIDGLKETHDFIRREGSFDKIMYDFELMKNKNIIPTAITTINSINIKELPQLRKVLIEKGVKGWQLQIGMPMGSMEKNRALVMDYKDVNKIIEFAYENLNDDRIYINFADCIGYYSFKDREVRKKYFNEDSYCWQGCGAGKANLGILHNGDIVGCMSIRDKGFIEGNIRNIPLEEIWNRPDSFSWNRNMNKKQLKGFCRECNYGEYCKGGCSNTKLCIDGDVYGSNKYCAYYLAVEKIRENFGNIKDVDTLYDEALKLAKNNQFQLAQIIVDYGIKIDGENVKLLSLIGYLNYKQERYKEAKEVNESILSIDKDNVYALKGLGLSLCSLNYMEAGISSLKRAIKLTNKYFMDPYKDLAIVLLNNDRVDEAKDILREAKEKSVEFVEKNMELYNKLKI